MCINILLPQLENQLIPGMETYSVFYPNKTLVDITVVGEVKGKFRLLIVHIN